MSYLVLARKYRPRNFSEMVGQEHVVRALTHALQQQRLHHAWLFTGTRGVGKTTVSRILAKSLNCTGTDGTGGITAQPCGQCPACREIDAGRFADYIELDAASNRGVDEVQTLLEQAVYKPVQGRFKVFMIDEVHMLTTTAFNAMLKTLEEPPPYLKFVLATTDPQKVPVTVLSRCLQFSLRPMSAPTVREHLARVLQDEGVSFELAALHLLAQAARGSMRDALSLTDQAIAFGAGAVQEQAVRHMLGSADDAAMVHILHAWLSGDGAALVAQTQALRTNGSSATGVLDALTAALQRIATFQAAPALAAQSDVGDAQAATLAELAQRMPPDVTQLLYSICLSGRTELGLAPDEYAALLMVLLRPLAFELLGEMPAQPAAHTLANVPHALVSTPPSPAAASLSEPFTPITSAAPIEPVRTELTPVSSPAAVPHTAAALSQPQSAAQASPQPIDSAPDPGACIEPKNQRLAPTEPQPSMHASSATVPASFIASAVESQAPSTDAADSGGDALTSTPASAHAAHGLDDFWHDTVTTLVAEQRITALTKQLAMQSQLLGRDDVAGWQLRVEKDSLNRGDCRQKLLAAIQSLYPACAALHIHTAPTSNTPAQREHNQREAQQSQLHAIVQADAQVRTLLNDWGAHIVTGSVREDVQATM